MVDCSNLSGDIFDETKIIICDYIGKNSSCFPFLSNERRDNKLAQTKKIQGKHRTVREDRPYTRDEIKRLVNLASLRNKTMILLMASSGMRRELCPTFGQRIWKKWIFTTY